VPTPPGANALAKAWDLSEAARRVLRADNHWQRLARLGQVTWAAGALGIDVRHLELPWRLPADAAASGQNFLTPAAKTAADELSTSREAGALVDVNRLQGNLLSSQPLAVNLFGPLRADLDLATEVLSQLFLDHVWPSPRSQVRAQPETRRRRTHRLPVSVRRLRRRGRALGGPHLPWHRG
jgi:hypothetical protein